MRSIHERWAACFIKTTLPTFRLKPDEKVHVFKYWAHSIPCLLFVMQFRCNMSVCFPILWFVDICFECTQHRDQSKFSSCTHTPLYYTYRFSHPSRWGQSRAFLVRVWNQLFEMHPMNQEIFQKQFSLQVSGYCRMNEKKVPRDANDKEYGRRNALKRCEPSLQRTSTRERSSWY